MHFESSLRGEMRRISYRNLEFCFLFYKTPQKSDDWLFLIPCAKDRFVNCVRNVFFGGHELIFTGSGLEVFKTSLIFATSGDTQIKILQHHMVNFLPMIYVWFFFYALARFQASKVSPPKGELYTMIM